MKFLFLSILFLIFFPQIAFPNGYTIESGDDGVTIKKNPNLKINGATVRALHNKKSYEIAKTAAKQCVEESKDPECEYFLGMYLFLNDESTAEDQLKGLPLIQSASKMKVTSADVLMGIFHTSGQKLINGQEVVKEDHKKAIEYWLRAANNCNVWAQNMLAQKYYFGHLASEDVKEAFYWINIAAHWDFPRASQGVEIIGQHLQENERDIIKQKSASFIEKSGCGNSPEKPVYFDYFGME